MTGTSAWYANLPPRISGIIGRAIKSLEENSAKLRSIVGDEGPDSNDLHERFFSEPGLEEDVKMLRDRITEALADITHALLEYGHTVAREKARRVLTGQLSWEWEAEFVKDVRRNSEARQISHDEFVDELLDNILR